MNKQALIKLAQVRLAINHVLRQRMEKKADILSDLQRPVPEPQYYNPFTGKKEYNPVQYRDNTQRLSVPKTPLKTISTKFVRGLQLAKSSSL